MFFSRLGEISFLNGATAAGIAVLRQRPRSREAGIVAEHHFGEIWDAIRKFSDAVHKERFSDAAQGKINPLTQPSASLFAVYPDIFTFLGRGWI